MSAWDEVGLIINPKAGQGYPANARAAAAVMTALRPRRIFTGFGELGAEALAAAHFNDIVVLPAGGAAGREQTQALAAALAARPISALVVVGGDGTLADVACALFGKKDRPALLGVGVGSTNAGNLITCRADALQRFDPRRLRVVPQRALLALDGDKILGMGFNDCVLGFTVVGTHDGAVQDLDAAAKLAGQTIPGKVRTVGTKQTSVQRSGPDGIVKVASGSKIATVVVGFAESSFFAKAITGGVCLASLVGAPAGCLVADQPLVRIGMRAEEVFAMPAINSAYLTFTEKHRIQVRGVKSGTAVCVDGNPVKLLGSQDSVEFGVTLEAARSLQLQ
jgi:hypothetical protein